MELTECDVPLREGSDNQTIAENIRRLRHAGYSQEESLELAYKKAGRYDPERKKKQ